MVLYPRKLSSSDCMRFNFSNQMEDYKCLCNEVFPDSTGPAVCFMDMRVRLPESVVDKFNGQSCHSLRLPCWWIMRSQYAKCGIVTSYLTWLITREGFIAFNSHESFKYYLENFPFCLFTFFLFIFFFLLSVTLFREL
jgi:hypothetical protein